MLVNLAGKKQGKHTTSASRVKSNPASVTTKVWGESEYYLGLENEDKKPYREKSTLEWFARFNLSVNLIL